MAERTVIYTDGSCLGNPGPGGWAWLVLAAGEVGAAGAGGAANTTNNRMELTAVIKALEARAASEALRVCTDSSYVVKGMTTWLEGWKRRGWMSASKKPVANQELWQRLDALAAGRDIDFVWVRGHAGDRGNDLADQAAQEQARRHAKGG